MLKTYQGHVIRALVAQGSKSERMAVMLDTGHERLVLRQRGGNAFRDDVLEGLVGQRITGRGHRTGYTLILEEWKTTKEENG